MLLEEAIGNLTSQISSLQNKNEELKQGKALYEDRNDQQKIQIKKFKEAIKDKESEISTLQDEKDSYMAQYSQQATENSSLQEEIKNLKHDRDLYKNLSSDLQSAINDNLQQSGQNAYDTDENENTWVEEPIERFLENQAASLFDKPNLLLVVIIGIIAIMINKRCYYEANYEELDIVFKPLNIAVGVIVAVFTVGILIPIMSGVLVGNLKRLWHAMRPLILFVFYFLLVFLSVYATLQGMCDMRLLLLSILILLPALTNPVVRVQSEQGSILQSVHAVRC